MGHSAGVMSVSFRSEGKCLLSASHDGTARIHPVEFEDVLAIARSREK